jgi:hypothetical protein
MAAIIVPFMNVAGEQARQTECRQRLKNLYGAAAMNGGDNGNLVPIVHQSVAGGIGKLLASGGRFAEKYLEQSWDSTLKEMGKVDNVFQCPSALDNPLELASQTSRKKSTNYSLSGFGLYTGGGTALSPEGLHPDMGIIRGAVQTKGAANPIGEVAMAVDWIRYRGSGTSSGYSQYNHRKGANVLYGSGAAKWVKYNSMVQVEGIDDMMVPPGTYGFIGGSTGGTGGIYTPPSIAGGTAGELSVGNDDKKNGVGIMW